SSVRRKGVFTTADDRTARSALPQCLACGYYNANLHLMVLTVLTAITPLVITYNEASNINRTLNKLTWAQRIVIIDSGSTDDTLAIVRRYPQAEIIYREFDDFATQCNFGLAKVTSEWVLSLDADYELSSELVRELKSLDPDAAVGGY